jgi:hypothetical protein
MWTGFEEMCKVTNSQETEVTSVYSAVRTESLYKADYVSSLGLKQQAIFCGTQNSVPYSKGQATWPYHVTAASALKPRALFV